MKNIDTLIKETKNKMYDISADFIGNYSGSTYICDAISEYADSNVSIYYSDIIRFISEHVEDVNDAIEEFGWDGCGADLYKAGQMAEYRQNELEIYKDLEEIIKVEALLIVRDEFGKQDITETELKELETELAGIESDSRFDYIRDAVYSVFDPEEEPEIDIIAAGIEAIEAIAETAKDVAGNAPEAIPGTI